jgi:hypothetical protein
MSMVGCTIFSPEPTPTPTATHTKIPTKTLTPTATITKTPKPSPTATVLSVSTNSLNNQTALSMSDECRKVIDGLNSLRKDLSVPDHFFEGYPYRQTGDFDPNSYFSVFTHLQTTPGYVLDYIYFGDDLGGLPLLYARKTNSVPFQSYEEFLESFGEEVEGERSYGELRHNYDYLEKIQIDDTPESYFEYVILAVLGDQFYLSWHSLYNDLQILCDSSDLQTVNADMEGFGIEFPQDVKDRIEKINLSPAVVVGDNDVSLRLVIFSKWGGFFENMYTIKKNNPPQLSDTKFNTLIEYDCGISF